MPSSTYLIPHRGLGAVQALPIYDAQTKENREFTVTLAPRPDGGLEVRTDSTIGHITSADRAEYPEIDLLLRAGLTPAATAAPQPDGSLSLLLPRPGLCLPANNPPAGPWTMLGYAPPIDIADLPADLDIPAHARMHVLVTLSPSTTGSGTDAYLGPQFVGRLEGVDVAKQGITLAHAYHAPRNTGRVLSIYAGAPLPDSKEASLADATPTSPAATETFETTSFRAISIDDSAPHRQWWPALIALLVIAALIAVLIFIL